VERQLSFRIENLLILEALKGGPGSGYHGPNRPGLPGVHGGSRPRGFTQGALFDVGPPQVPAKKPAKKPPARRGTGFGNAISDGEITSSSTLGAGITRSEVVEIEGPDGKTYTAILKPMAVTGMGSFHDGNSEVAAYAVANLLGIDRVPETAYAYEDSGLGVWEDSVAQRFIDGAETYNWLPIDDRVLTEDVKRDIVALDIVMYNVDRHNQNWVRDPAGKVWAIDHGHAAWERFEDSNKAPMWNTEILDGRGRRPSGSFFIGFERVNRWSKITRTQFDAAFEGIDQSRNVNADNAWDNLQFIIEEGGLIRW
jgi:hypothetical protein